MSSSNCCFLTCMQISQEVGKVVWYSHLFKNFPQLIVIYTVKDFDIINKGLVDVFLEFSFFFYNPQTADQLYQRNSHTVKRVLGTITDFPTWGSGQEAENPQKIWLWRPVGFDYRTYTGLRNRFLEGTNKTLCTPGPRRKEQWSHKRLTQTCLWVSKSFWRRCGLVVACFRVRDTKCNSMCLGPFEGGSCYIHYLHHSLVSGQTTGRESSPTHQQKIGLKVYWAWPCPQEQDSFPRSQSFPSGSFHKPLILIHQREDRRKTTVTEN